jgi:hypothetical protein
VSLEIIKMILSEVEKPKRNEDNQIKADTFKLMVGKSVSDQALQAQCNNNL